MKTKTFNKTNLSEEILYPVIERQLIINKSKILALTEKLKLEDSLSSLRKSVFYLERNLQSIKTDKIGILNIDTNGDTITISNRYVFDQLDQIVKSQTLDRAKYYVERFEKALTQIRTSKINDINLNRWKEYDDIRTDSLWMLDKRDSSGVHKADYWGNFIPQIPNQMIKRYTKKGEWVLDTFAGCGTTLIEAQGLGRNSIGIELQADVAETANNLIKSEPNKFNVVSKVIAGDSTEIDYEAVL